MKKPYKFFSTGKFTRKHISAKSRHLERSVKLAIQHVPHNFNRFTITITDALEFNGEETEAIIWQEIHRKHENTLDEVIHIKHIHPFFGFTGGVTIRNQSWRQVMEHIRICSKFARTCI